MSRSSSSRSEIRLYLDASTAFWSTATTERSLRQCTGEQLHSEHIMKRRTHRHKSNVLTDEHRSCSGRDRLGPFPLSDCSWLTSDPVNPLAVGQYVNNCSNGQSVWLQFVPSTVIKENIRLLSVLSSTEKAANVCYQEYDVLDGFPLELRQFLPNVNYRADIQRQDFICHYYY